MEATMNNKIIAIDFDGTITEPSPYPITGSIRPKAIEVIKKLQKQYTCILWTCRTGNDLAEAIRLLEYHGVNFEYVNTGPQQYRGSNKIFAHVYIDDKAFGTEIDWNKIEEILLGADK